jgi:hypothetical protein
MLQQGSFDQQTGLANQGAVLQQRGMNDAAMQGYLQQLTGMDQATWQREMMRRQLAGQDRGAIGGLMQAGGSALATYASGGFGGGPLFGAAPGTMAPQAGTMPRR